MIHPLLIERLHESASIQRWNDFAKPVEFTELDKQAHKMTIAYVLARSELDRGSELDWLALIEGGIFEFLHRVVLTDIKPHVFHRMMKEKGAELNRWVVGRLQGEFAGLPEGFGERFATYFSDPGARPREKRLLRAAHYLATQWEFNIIYKSCPFLYGIEEVNREIEAQLSEHTDLPEVAAIAESGPLHSFVSLCGQLRFQRRWSETPRVPQTSVLGHMLLVAVMSYLLVLEFKPCRARARNAFLCALFHDLPEVLTRDIASPIKTAVEGLDELIKEYEQRVMEEKLLPLLPDAWREEVRYFTGEEFENRTLEDGKVRTGLSLADLQEQFNQDRFQPVDGEMIRVCDHLAAFLEANLSITHGITSRTLRAARRDLLARYRGREYAGIPVGQLFVHLAEGE
jgi:putative hydrolase of HD superfamily